MNDAGSGRTEEWLEAGRPLRGFRDWLMVIIAVVYHLVTLQWLRAPAWKNKPGARSELARLVEEHSSLPYDYWTQRLDRKKRVEFTSDDGTWYQATLEPVWDDKVGGAIRVLISIDDGGIGAFHPMGDSLLIVPPGERDREEGV